MRGSTVKLYSTEEARWDGLVQRDSQADGAYLYGVAGAIVALIITYSGYAIGREAVGVLLGEAPSSDLVREIEDSARTVPGVRGVHDVIVHRYGQTSLVSLHIEVLDTEPAAVLHDVSEQVEDRIVERTGGTAVVHIDPLNKMHERYAEFEGLIQEQVERDERIDSFHDMRIVGHGQRTKVVFDLVLIEGVSEREVEAIKWVVEHRLGRCRSKV